MMEVMRMLTDTVEVAKWIPVVALIDILFLQGVLVYIVWSRRKTLMEKGVRENEIKS